MSKVRPIASATIGTDGAGPLLPPVRSHSVKSLALTTDESATTAPVDKIDPAGDDHHGRADGKHAEERDSVQARAEC